MNTDYTLENGWYGVPGYENQYRFRYKESAPFIEIISLPNDKTRKQKQITPWKRVDGYMSVNVTDNNNRKSPTVHRLLAQAYIPNPNQRRFVNHKNGNKTDNRIDNLEWVTAQENVQHAIDTGLNKIRKLSDDDVAKIITDNKLGKSQTRIAQEFNIHQSTVSRIVAGLKRKSTLRRLCLLVV